MIGIRSHFAAGTGALAIESREESRAKREIISELPPNTTVAEINAPQGILRDARTGRAIDPNAQPTPLAAAYAWAASAPARVLIVYDWHVLVNNPGHWRALIEALPALRSPKGARPTDPASLVIFVGPTFELTPQNPLRGALPILPFAPPDRAAIARTAESLHAIPADIRESVIDSLCGLPADAAEQCAAEVLARGAGWNVAELQRAKIRELRSAGLEYWEPVADLGGLSGLRDFAESEVFPWLRDPQLSVRRLLCAGLPGTGKSYCAKWIGHRLSAPIVRLSIPALKAGIVGASEGNLRRALRTVDAQAAHAPLVLVLDEIDTIARDGLDGGTSSGMFAELLTWMQESASQTVVIATLNRLDKLDAALESRFQCRFFYDLPTKSERQAIASIHLARVQCEGGDSIAKAIADATEGFSSREIGTQLIPSLARTTNRKPKTTDVQSAVASITPASRTQQEQLAQMRRAAATLRRANDPDDAGEQTGRRQVTSATYIPQIDPTAN